MAEDHLDKETSVSAELTPTGVKASAKSRFIAAFDRLGGNIIDLANAPMEARTNEKRAIAEARIRAIEAATQIGIERMKTDPEFAERALNAHLGKVFARQENKDGVVEKAIEDLRCQPPTEEEAVSGPEVLDEAFHNRFERYAEEATTDELREKWGRVLAAEIRKPGTFSGKVLRVIDELDADTAKLFERVCQFRILNYIPKALVDDLEFLDLAALVNADLLVEPGMGQAQHAGAGTDAQGNEIWFWSLGNVGLATSKSSIEQNSKWLVTGEKNFPALPVYVLTNVGVAICSILPDNQGSIIDEFAFALSEAMPSTEVRKMVFVPHLDQWHPIKIIPPKQAPS